MTARFSHLSHTDEFAVRPTELARRKPRYRIASVHLFASFVSARTFFRRRYVKLLRAIVVSIVPHLYGPVE